MSEASFYVMIEAVSGRVVERFEGTSGDLLNRLDEVRGSAGEDEFFTFARGATALEAEGLIEAKIERGRRVHQERRQRLDALPPVQGEPEIDKGAWERLRAVYGNAAGTLANLAAHSWAVLPQDGCVVVVGHGDYGTRFNEDGSKESLGPGEAPHLCQSCIHTKRYLATRGVAKPLMCDLDKFVANDPGVGLLRRVGRIQSCSAWTKP